MEENINLCPYCTIEDMQDGEHYACHHHYYHLNAYEISTLLGVELE